LPGRTGAAVTLQLAGHSHGEIADRPGMTPRTVERQLLRARGAVRQAREAALAA
jgi:DNA-directed RNA polymerase specialized sigma24 family protein